MMRTVSMAAAASLLAGCAATPGPETGVTDGGGACEAEAGQAFVGQKASSEVGQQLLKATGAKQLRWAPPRSAMTMDFRADRLTVEYDDDMVITRASCG